jgi:hypothetical protein
VKKPKAIMSNQCNQLFPPWAVYSLGRRSFFLFSPVGMFDLYVSVDEKENGEKRGHHRLHLTHPSFDIVKYDQCWLTAK